MRNLLIILSFLPFSTSSDNFHKVKEEESNLVPENVTNTNLDNEVVTLTTYVPNQKETDSSPHITASGFKIDSSNPKKHRIIAISRDLKKKWGFNKKVRIRKAGKYNGVYVIKDVMNKRFRKRIDILVGENDKPTKLTNVHISLVR
jgi:3D (Asp-Asp-Asp) domain-containing protein